MTNRKQAKQLKENLGSFWTGGRWYEAPHIQRNGVDIRPNDMLDESDVDDDDFDDDKPLAACVLIISDDGKILAVSRKDDPSDFGLPGGKVDSGEKPIQSAARELKEETGLDATNLRHVFTADDGEYVVSTYVGEIDGTIDTDESGVIRWVEPGVLISSSSFSGYNRQLLKKLGIL